MTGTFYNEHCLLLACFYYLIFYLTYSRSPTTTTDNDDDDGHTVRRSLVVGSLTSHQHYISNLYEHTEILYELFYGCIIRTDHRRRRVDQQEQKK